ncbi:DEAD/DEAH box helicase [Catenovulum sediminis]|uniref:DEAD/DEAH box helicase n=1 Tax=Catenovulum sediminis TaxID=1740262 RepID=A0ABV1RH13_9ALTE
MQNAKPPYQYKLRPYQQQAVDATLAHFRKSNASAVIVLPTGSGKSLVIAELAKMAKGHILVLTHVKELVAQNYEKYCAFADNAGIYSAGLKRKQTDKQVTFASIQSAAPNLQDFSRHYSLVIIDECHRISLPKRTIESAQQNNGQDKKNERKPQQGNTDNQYQKVISQLKNYNPQLKILGLTATPYRLDSGWIYQYHYYGFARCEQAVQFDKCIFEQPLAVMIKQGYLTPPKRVNAATEHYDFSSLKATANGEYKPNEINALLNKFPRVTQAICQQIFEIGETRQGVMVFAATVEHAQEITNYLLSYSPSVALITGATEQIARDNYIQAFKDKQLKYLVNVSVLTTGFDAPHVDFIAILRPTQSVSLYQQIVGRGLRLAENKNDCLVIDYAGNDFDLFYPEVGSVRPNKNTVPVQVPCPKCEFANIFWGKVDADGDIIEHYGRRCWGLIKNDPPTLCDYRFKFKQCPNCQQENDIAARKCGHCLQVLVDPDEQIKNALKLKDAMVIRCAGLTTQVDGNVLKITYFDEDGAELKESFNFENKKQTQLFNQQFVKRILNAPHPLVITNVAKLNPYLDKLPEPDFVIARQVNKQWRVRERIFDYQGNYRKANQI